jgi:hypothetical protein
MSKSTRLIIASTIALASIAPQTADAQSLLSPVEIGCAGKLGKAASKLASTYVRETMRCRDADVSGKITGVCPSADNLAKIDKIATKLAQTIDSQCASVCSVSQSTRCVANHLCPPRPNPEACTAGASNLPFDMSRLGFPGAFCEGVLGHEITSTDDIRGCVEPLTKSTAGLIVDSIYGSIDSASGLSKTQAACLSAIGKGAAKLSQTIYKGVVGCRSDILKGKVKRNPRTCTLDDEKVVAKVAKMEAKLADLMDSKCTDADILALDLCGAGVGGTPDRVTARDCVVAIVSGLTDSPEPTELRAVVATSLIEAAFPPSPVCGDGVVNQLPNPYLLVGEECDGDDDTACPGACNPPGDVFECTCNTARRQRFIADGFTADLDTGWNGNSHDSGVTDGAGFVLDIANCDCDVMDGAACGGVSADPVCDTSGHQMPTCTWDPFSTTRCDNHGDNDNRDEPSDCWVCDERSVNSGTSCKDDADCTPQCFDAAGVVTGTCAAGQSDCAPGEVCRGRCDTSQGCLFIPLGAPLPLSAGGAPTCVINIYRDDIFGTRNIVTGEQETFSRHYSTVYLGNNNAVPCPVCGGFCDGGGPLDGDTCSGRCSDDQSDCRFDSDCNPGATCKSDSPECPDGFCNLSLVCSGGPNAAQPCRIGAATPLFGTTSLDCPPPPATNISGNGIEINFFPATSEVQTLPFSVPCTAPGFALFDCPCPDGGGTLTRPNACAAACNAGAEFGQGCANGSAGGTLTTCEGGPEDGHACDADSDCAPGTCSRNPTHCTGDPAYERFACSTNGDCGLGTCVDACPSGRCVPLCVPEVDDPEDGVCAAGPTAYHCSGEKDVFRTCTDTAAKAGCSATCSVSATPCTGNTDCPTGESCLGACAVATNCEAGGDGQLGTFDDLPGAGICIGDNRNCFLDPIQGEGGDIFNGQGDPNNAKSVSIYCVGKTSAAAINTSAGLGGAGRLRQSGVNVSSGFTSLP